MITINDLVGLIEPGDKVLAAVSGGMDSMALLHRLNALKEEGGFELTAVTINHHLRGEESELDMSLVEDFCIENDIEIYLRSVNVLQNSASKGFSIEQEARKLRYEVFTEVSKLAACNKVATAHHMLDQAETILMNLFRGCGASGASGMERVRDNIIIRPMLKVRKEDIIKYVTDNDIPYRDDYTNEDMSFSRNYVRREIMPLIAGRWPAAVDALIRFADNAEGDEELINALLEPDIEQRGSEIFVPLYYYKYRALGKRASARALEMLDSVCDVSAQNYADIHNLKDSEAGARILLPRDMLATRDYGHIVFSKDEIKTYTYEEPFSESLVKLPTGRVTTRRAERGEMRSAMRNPAKDGERVLYADYNSIPMSAVWRTRRDGDMIIKFGGGTKKLNDYLSELKIPQRYRDSVPLLCSSNKVLLIAGYEISERLRVTGDDIVAITYSPIESIE